MYQTSSKGGFMRSKDTKLCLEGKREEKKDSISLALPMGFSHVFGLDSIHNFGSKLKAFLQTPWAQIKIQHKLNHKHKLVQVKLILQ